MSEILEGWDYFSPGKSLYLDHNDTESSSNIEGALETFSTSLENVWRSLDKCHGDHSVASEALNSGESGFNEFSPTTSSGDESQPAASVLDVSAKSDVEKNEVNDRDGVSSTVRNMSDLSGLSDSSGQDWKPKAGDHSVASEALNSGESGFNEFSPTTSSGDESQPAASVLDVSAKSDVEKNEVNDRDGVSSTVRNMSDLSGLSDSSGQDWKPKAGHMGWIQQQMVIGADPRKLLSQLVCGLKIPHRLDDVTLWKIIVNVLSESPRREKLRHINSLADVVRLLHGAKNVIVVTGAGISVSCGMPDFRSRDGIYSRLAVDFPDLPHPQAMFDFTYFKQDPRPFFRFAREIYPGQFKPSPCHRFISALERHKKLLRNYTQNIDSLEKVAGIQNVIECHGSFATASCTRCEFKVTANEIRKDVFTQRIPMCPKCSQSNAGSFNGNKKRGDWYRDVAARGVMKPNIVFFGEDLPEAFHDAMAKDEEKCDLLLVIGSSLKVKPVALIPSSIPSHVPQILINRERLHHLNFDVELLGNSDVIINQLCHMLGDEWKEECWQTPLTETRHLTPVPRRRRRRKGSETSVEQHPILAPTSPKENRIGHCANEEADDKNMPKEESGVSNAANEMETYGAPMTTDEIKTNEDWLMMNCWQPEVRESLASRLQENSYYRLLPNLYIFPGAEVYCDPDEE